MTTQWKCSQCGTLYSANNTLESDIVGSGITNDPQGDCPICGAGWVAVYANN